MQKITTAVYVIPTDAADADGTLAWDKTTLVLASARSGAAWGIGWTYGAAAAPSVIAEVLAGAVVGRSALDVPGAAEAVARAVRNIGRPGGRGDRDLRGTSSTSTTTSGSSGCSSTAP